MRGANGRPVVLAAVKYSVDVASLKEYAATDEAARTLAKSESTQYPAMTRREIIRRFLHYVQDTSSGDGLCSVTYTRCEIGQALVDAGFLKHARLYPDKWPCCATQLGSDLRAIALGKFYAELDDRDAFHKLLQAQTQNPEAKALIERIISDEALKPSLSEYYFGTSERTKEVKMLLHSMSNGGSAREWRVAHKVSRADDPAFIVDLHRVMGDVTHEIANTGVGPEAKETLLR